MAGRHPPGWRWPGLCSLPCCSSGGLVQESDFIFRPGLVCAEVDDLGFAGSAFAAQPAADVASDVGAEPVHLAARELDALFHAAGIAGRIEDDHLGTILQGGQDVAVHLPVGWHALLLPAEVGVVQEVHLAEEDGLEPVDVGVFHAGRPHGTLGDILDGGGGIVFASQLQLKGFARRRRCHASKVAEGDGDLACPTVCTHRAFRLPGGSFGKVCGGGKPFPDQFPGRCGIHNEVVVFGRVAGTADPCFHTVIPPEVLFRLDGDELGGAGDAAGEREVERLVVKTGLRLGILRRGADGFRLAPPGQ